MGNNRLHRQIDLTVFTLATGTLSKSEAKLRTSRFRYLNEQLYTQTGEASFKMFRKDPAAFKAYHEGYMEQGGGSSIDWVRVSGRFWGLFPFESRMELQTDTVYRTLL